MLDSADEPIGVGGMGQVYKGICVNERTGATRPVAIKFMFDDLPAQAIERARREASIQLRNDNLVEMLGFIEINEQTPSGVVKHYHVVSELLNGVSLYDIFEGKTTDRDGEDVAYAVKLMQDYKNDPEHFAKIIVVNVLSGLMALHDAGYIHRDIDPSNIMVTSDGHIKLIDFGIAKQMNTLTTSDKSLTVAGKFMGKPEYAAPELALGDIQHQNQTTDIYAMGILLYQCIVGHTPFEGARHEILDKQLKAKLPLDVIQNKDLKAIIAKACEKKQELRFQTSAQMRVALENPKSMQGGLSRQKKIGIAIAVVALVIVLGIAGIVAKNKQDAAKAEAEKDNVATYVDNLGRLSGQGYDNLTLAMVETKTNSILKPVMSKQTKIILVALAVFCLISIAANVIQAAHYTALSNQSVSCDSLAKYSQRDSVQQSTIKVLQDSVAKMAVKLDKIKEKSK